MSNDIKRAEKRGRRVGRKQSQSEVEWQTTQNTNLRLHHELAVLRTEAQTCRDCVTGWSNRAAKAEAERDRLQAEVGRGPCTLPCFRLQQEQVAVSSLESDVRRLTAERDQLRGLLDEWAAKYGLRETKSDGDLMQRTAAALREADNPSRESVDAAQNAAESDCDKHWLGPCAMCGAAMNDRNRRYHMPYVVPVCDRCYPGAVTLMEEVKQEVRGLRAEGNQLRASLAIAVDGPHSRLGQMTAERDEVQVHLDASERERDRLTEECDALFSQRAEGSALGDMLAGALAQAIAERDLLRQENDRLSQERNRLVQENGRLQALNADLNAVNVDALAEVGRLRDENAAQMEELIGYSYTSAFTVEALADAKRGRLVVAMPVNYQLMHRWEDDWLCCKGSYMGTTAEVALADAGIVDPLAGGNAEPPALHPDATRLNWLSENRCGVDWGSVGEEGQWRAGAIGAGRTLREAIDRAREAAGAGAEEEAGQ